MPTADNSNPLGASPQIVDDELYDLEAVCRFFGGTKPLNPATVYRNIAKGLYPRPVRVSANSNRWLGGELRQALSALIAEPRSPLRSPRVRGSN